MKRFITIIACVFMTGCIAETAVEPTDVNEPPVCEPEHYCRNIDRLRKLLSTHVSTLACEADEDCPGEAVCVCGGCGVP